MVIQATTTDEGTGEGWSWLAILGACLAVFALAMATRMGLLSSPLFFDEFYHVLAAQGLNATGEPTIGTGTYDRVYLYTWFVAQVFSFAENDIAAARTASAIVCSLLIVVSFAWLRRHAGWVSAIAATALAVLSPIGIDAANLIRFYAWLGLAFFLFAAAVYSASTGKMGLERRIATWLAAAILGAVSLYLQPLAAAGMAGIALWWGIAVFLPWAWKRQARVLIILGALVLAVVAFGGAFAAGLVEAAWRELRFAPDWASAVKDSELYYHRYLSRYYEILWPLFPVALIAALAHKFRPALFCASILLVSLVFLSIAGMKSARYIFFVMPFFFAIYGIAISGLLTWLWNWVAKQPASARGADRNPSPYRSVLAGLGVLAMLAAVLANTAFALAIGMARGEHVAIEFGDWQRGGPALKPLIADDMIVATPRELQAFYYFGRVDITLSVSRLSELEDRIDFEIDPRTGLPTVGTADGALTLIACTPSGFFIVPSGAETWIRPIFPEPETYQGPATLSRVPEADQYGFEVIQWSNDAVDPGQCDGVPDHIRSRGA